MKDVDLVRGSYVLSWCGDCGGTYSCTFPFENVSEVLEIRVASAHDRMSKLEGWDVCTCVNLVGCVH